MPLSAIGLESFMKHDTTVRKPTVKRKSEQHLLHYLQLPQNQRVINTSANTVLSIWFPRNSMSTSIGRHLCAVVIFASAIVCLAVDQLSRMPIGFQ
jgi:hypothetical protein